MKKFMQMLLAAFGVLSLVLAGCAQQAAVEDEDEDEEAVEEVEADEAEEVAQPSKADDAEEAE